MSKPSPARYSTTNWPSYTAALRKRGSLLIRCPATHAFMRERVVGQGDDLEMIWLAPHVGSPGRPAVFSDAAIQF